MRVTRDTQVIYEQVTGFFMPAPPKALGVAVSGGSDSLGLLVLLAQWAAEGNGPEVHAVTVDHGLRAEAAEEAREVARICADLEVPHDILRWNGWTGVGNLQQAARRARYDLMSDWARQKGIDQVAVAHTADDQAETTLMRLARESGLDGLSAMTAKKRHGRMIFCRPALGVRREDLRDILRNRGLAWIDDPSNIDPEYDRVKAREALAVLEPLGVSVTGLSRTAGHLAKARDTLNWYAFVAARDLGHVQGADIVLDRRKFRILPDEIGRRVLLEALRWVSGAAYGPRGKTLELLMESLRCGNDMTLRGCHVSVTSQDIRITREYKAVAHLVVNAATLWDGRWQLEGPWPDGARIAALGAEGVARCPEWRATGLPLRSLSATPAVWRGEELIAAPLAGLSNGWHAINARPEDDFFAAFLSH
jgi:tRNA(Ile)-lysidine synthase